MNNEFILSRDLVAHAIENPFKNCRSPIRAAYGRVAEPFIVDFAAKHLGLNVENFNSEKLPPVHRQKLGKDKRHDGLIFDDNGEFVGVIEAKLALRAEVKISNEVDVFQYCKKHNLMYVVALGEMTSVKELKCHFMGVFNLCENEHVLNYDSISVPTAKNILID